MPKATYNGTVLAESDRCETVEGNYYFPPDSIARDYFTGSSTETTCGWKGTAKYYNLEIDGKTVADAAWYYPEPKSAAANIKGYIAFYRAKGIQVES